MTLEECFAWIMQEAENIIKREYGAKPGDIIIENEDYVIRYDGRDEKTGNVILTKIFKSHTCKIEFTIGEGQEVKTEIHRGGHGKIKHEMK